MPYELAFKESARKEWDKLGGNVRAELKKALAKRLEAPRSEGNRLRGHPDRYKIKLRKSGYRLVYEVQGDKLVVVLVIDRRDRGVVYRKAEKIDPMSRDDALAAVGKLPTELQTEPYVRPAVQARIERMRRRRKKQQ